MIDRENNYDEETQGSFSRKNIVLIYVLAIPMLIVLAVLMAISAREIKDFVPWAFITATPSALNMAYLQRKLEFWTFSLGQRLVTLMAIVLVFVGSLVGFRLFLISQYSLPMTLAVWSYLLLSGLAIFALVDRMKVPRFAEDKQLLKTIGRARNTSVFLMYAFLGLPILIALVGYAV